MAYHIERDTEEVKVTKRWKVKRESTGDSLLKLTMHDESGSTPHAVQVKFLRTLKRDCDHDELQANKSLFYHRVVARALGPNSCRAIGEAFMEAADEMEKRKSNVNH